MLYINGLQWNKTQLPIIYANGTNKAIYNPACNNGGQIQDVTTTEPGPMSNFKTWKLTKTGTANQWHGWESNYSGLFNCKAGEYWSISGYYKTNNAAGVTNLAIKTFSKPDWSEPYNTTIVDSSKTIIQDGKWHYFYCTIRANEDMINPIICNGPGWVYSTLPGVLYINGLQWIKNEFPQNFIDLTPIGFTNDPLVCGSQYNYKIKLTGGNTNNLRNYYADIYTCNSENLVNWTYNKRVNFSVDSGVSEIEINTAILLNTTGNIWTRIYLYDDQNELVADKIKDSADYVYSNSAIIYLYDNNGRLIQ
ncbi:MAG: hypothetical protein AAGU27_26870 [Dehalobacterium sp.]